MKVAVTTGVLEISLVKLRTSKLWHTGQMTPANRSGYISRCRMKHVIGFPQEAGEKIAKDYTYPCEKSRPLSQMIIEVIVEVSNAAQSLEAEDYNTNLIMGYTSNLITWL